MRDHARHMRQLSRTRGASATARGTIMASVATLPRVAVLDACYHTRSVGLKLGYLLAPVVVQIEAAKFSFPSKIRVPTEIAQFVVPLQ